MRANGKDILDGVRTSGDLAKETEDKLKALLDRFAKRFAA